MLAEEKIQNAHFFYPNGKWTCPKKCNILICYNFAYLLQLEKISILKTKM